MITVVKLPFATHAVIETAAALSFIFRPEAQLPGCSPAARLILRQYGGLLLASSLMCVAVLVAEPGLGDTTMLMRLLAIALGTYHVWPCHRAWVRLRSGRSATLGGPALHLVVHLLCLGLFTFSAAASPSRTGNPRI
ncbi:hypothetical protein F4775DRAFT_384086 [Biscogniauxia sp. FL1348]|nr:hypothetical protein F4775DRAFT_384086 [Biscogniauxia sp. FL1348]